MGIIVNDDSNPIGVHAFTLDVTKANPYKDGATGRFTTGGGGATNPGAGSSLRGKMQRAKEQGMENAVGDMNAAVNGASSLAIQHGDVKMKDAAYSATKEATDAQARIDSGKHESAKEYMEVASNTLQGLPEMAEKAGLSSEIVNQLSAHANNAYEAYQAFYAAWKK